MKKVIILKLEDYQLDLIKSKITSVLEQYFPFEKYFDEGDKILLKPNLLMAAAPNEAVTTHPVFIEAVGQIFKEKKHDVSIADSPGGFTSLHDMGFIYKECGISDFAYKNGFHLLYPDNSVLKDNIPFCKWAVEGYKIINLPKLKTHEITLLTLAAKNIYGCISGLHKSHLHGLYPKTKDFTKIIIKINKFIKPQLHIVDGILAMEGNGPSKTGTPRKMNTIVIGDDPFAVDFAITKLVNLTLSDNPVLTEANRVGLFDEREVEIISEFGDLIYKDFKIPKQFFLNKIPDAFLQPLKSIIKRRPAIKTVKCKNCGVCIEVCPQKAVFRKNNKVTIDYKKCIMCMCCMEMCEYGAVDIEKSWAIKLISFFSAILRRR